MVVDQAYAVSEPDNLVPVLLSGGRHDVLFPQQADVTRIEANWRESNS